MKNHTKVTPLEANNPFTLRAILKGAFTNSAFWITFIALEGLYLLDKLGVL